RSNEPEGPPVASRRSVRSPWFLGLVAPSRPPFAGRVRIAGGRFASRRPSAFVAPVRRPALRPSDDPVDLREPRALPSVPGDGPPLVRLATSLRVAGPSLAAFAGVGGSVPAE